MKIFAVYGKLEKKSKPKWLGDFVKKYKFNYDFHITFKQPCFIGEKQGIEIKSRLTNLFKEIKFVNHKISIIFDKILSDPDKECVMLKVKENPRLTTLQKKIIDELKDYQNYCKLETKEYEGNFVPHLTIAMDLKKGSYQKALQNIPNKFKMFGEIKKVILSVVNKNSPEESKNPNNLRIFNL